MARRRRRSGSLASIGVLLLGAAVGAALLSVFFRTREPSKAPAIDPELTIEVLNGCGSRGAADRAAMLLRRGGFQVERVGNADHFHYREDIIVARRVRRSQILDLGRVLGGAVVIEQRIAGHDYDVTVIVGKPRSLIPDD